VLCREAPGDVLEMERWGLLFDRDEDGRIAQLTPDGVAPGEYQLLFELEDYFVDRPHLFQVVTLEVLIDEERPYHIPLLLSPFGISSYRGS